MDRFHLYLKKIIALFLSGLITWLILFVTGYPELPNSIPLSILILSFASGFLVFAFLNFKISGEKPKFLFGLSRSDESINKKGGLWLLFKWVLNLFGFVYDLVVWVVNGIYLLFLIIIDVFLLIKLVIFWVIHAIVWFLRLFVPPLVFIYEIFMYYLIRWPWWIYKLTFRNAITSINRNFYAISLWGIIPSIFIFLLFLGAGILVDYSSIAIIGAAFALLPLIWSYTEISAVRSEGREDAEYIEIKKRFGRGFIAVRSVLHYFIFFLILLIIEILMNMLGWVNSVGFTILSISLNINTLLSIFLLAVLVILIFAKFLMPPNVVLNPVHGNSLQGSIRFLGVIGKRFLRYIFAHLPAGIFSVFLLIIPFLFTFLAVLMTLELKNTMLDNRISALRGKLLLVPEIESFEIENHIGRLEYYKNFPQVIFGDFTGLKDRIKNRNYLQDNILAGQNELRRNELLFLEDIDSLKKQIGQMRTSGDTLSSNRFIGLKNGLDIKQEDFNKWKIKQSLNIAELKADLRNEKGMIAQLPIAFFFVIVWLSLFGGLVLGFVVSYLGNVYHELYSFKDDGKPSYFQEVIYKLNRKERNQPLLGFTLIFIILILYLSDRYTGWLSTIIVLI